jgi:hypothetical protein
MREKSASPPTVRASVSTAFMSSLAEPSMMIPGPRVSLAVLARVHRPLLEPNASHSQRIAALASR